MHSDTDLTPGCRRLVERLDAAVAAADTAAICQNVKKVLQAELAASPDLVPETLLQPDPQGYARRLLFKCPQERFSVVLMVWDAGQETPLHDHAGHWCVECVYQGQIQVTSYDARETRDDELVRFTEERSTLAGIGAAGALIPPFEYHTIANPFEVKAVTLHVYGGEITWCHAFEPVEESGWYRKERHELSYSYV